MLCLFQQLCSSHCRINQQALAHRATYGKGPQPNTVKSVWYNDAKSYSSLWKLWVFLSRHPGVLNLMYFSFVPFSSAYCCWWIAVCQREITGPKYTQAGGSRGKCVLYFCTFLAATEGQALMCSIFRSSNPSNNCDMSGICHVYVFLKGVNVKSSLPFRLAFLEKGTLCHTKSLVPYVPPPLCWWQQLSYAPKVSCWVTGTKASK